MPADDATTIVPAESPAAEPFDPRPYLQIRPTETPTDPEALARAVDRVHTALDRSTKTGLLARWSRSSDAPTVELLLVSSGQPDPVIRFLVGATDPTLLDECETALRTGFPDDYEFSTIDWHPRELERQVGTADDRADRTPAGVVVTGEAQFHKDWQQPIRLDDSTLATIVETMAGAELPVLYQVLATPFPDWTDRAEQFTADIERGLETWFDKTRAFFNPSHDETFDPASADRRRIEAIHTRDPTRTFRVSARAVILAADDGPEPHRLAAELAGIITTPGHDEHRLTARVVDAPGDLYTALLTRTLDPVEYARLRNRFPFITPASRGIVMTADELVALCRLDGVALSSVGRRALSTRPAERTGLPPPPPDLLTRHTGPGQAVGMPLDTDRRPVGVPFTIRVGDQAFHVLVIGTTGSGKSILTEIAALTNHRATDGPEIIVDLKGGGTAQEYLQAHYATYGSLDDVIYFDCSRVLPALSVLDLGPLLEAGIPREEATSRLVGHYEEILAMLMGPDRFWRAAESPKVIRNHLRALFDPIHGTDAVSTNALYHALKRTHEDHAPPTVSNERLQTYLTTLLNHPTDYFNNVLAGAQSRVDTLLTDGRLGPIFDHSPTEDGPSFDFADVINDSTVVIFDFGGMEDRAKASVTGALFSTLWRALHVRRVTTPATESLPLVNLYIEEAGVIGGSSLLDTLLSQGRSFGLSVMLGVQFPGQLDSPTPDSRTYEEALNETATVITGQVATATDLAGALATEAVPRSAVARRLARMPRGEWLIRPGSGFGEETIAPFLMESLPAPTGHPASDAPLAGADLAAFETTFADRQAAVRDAAGLPIDDATDHPETARSANTDGEPSSGERPHDRLDSIYPRSRRMPKTVDYNPETHALVCLVCGNRYNPDIDGMLRAIDCHASLEQVDRKAIPVGPTHLKLSPEERAASPLTDAQLLFVQVVYNIQQRRYHPLEYHIVFDSMILVKGWTGISDAEIQDLIDTGHLTQDTDHPHRLYSVTKAGRDAIGEAYRQGIDFGHGKGDLDESSEHLLGVAVGERLIVDEYVAAESSPAVTCSAYHELDRSVVDTEAEQRRLDIAALDSAGDIVVTVEVERINHDWREAIPADYDKMAACEPDEAIWLVMNQSDGHRVLQALNDPPDGRPRVSKTYAATTPPQQFRIDEPGLTDIYPVEYVRDTILEWTPDQLVAEVAGQPAPASD